MYMMGSLLLTGQCPQGNGHDKSNIKPIVVMKTEGPPPPPPSTSHHLPATDQYKTVFAQRPPNQTLPLAPHFTVRGCQADFLGQKLRQTFTLSWPGPGGGLTVDQTAHVSEMD